MIPLTRAIPDRIRSGLRRCAIQVDVYFTLNITGVRVGVNVVSIGPSEWTCVCTGYRSVRRSRVACRRGPLSAQIRWATATCRLFHRLNDAVPTLRAAHGTPDSGLWFVSSVV